MQATEEILKAQTDLAELTEKQLAIGTVSKVDVTSQRTLVSNSQVDLLNYERNLAFARNQLAVLVGELPSNANITKFDASAFSTHFAGEVKGFNIEDYIPAKEARHMDGFIH